MQLPLPLNSAENPDLKSFVIGPNLEAWAAVAEIAEALAPTDSFVFLYGDTGTGKSHLLQGACRACLLRNEPATYIPLKTLGLHKEILNNLEDTSLIAIDDLDSISGQPDWEYALFDLFNRIREQRKRLLVTASSTPDFCGIQMPDLKSRLKWGPAYHLFPLRDEDCYTLLQQQAKGRAFELGSQLCDYIVRHGRRDVNSLTRLIIRLDQLCLSAQKRPNLFLVKEAMAQIEGEDSLGKTT